MVFTPVFIPKKGRGAGKENLVNCYSYLLQVSGDSNGKKVITQSEQKIPAKFGKYLVALRDLNLVSFEGKKPVGKMELLASPEDAKRAIETETPYVKVEETVVPEQPVVVLTDKQKRLAAQFGKIGVGDSKSGPVQTVRAPTAIKRAPEPPKQMVFGVNGPLPVPPVKPQASQRETIPPEKNVDTKIPENPPKKPHAIHFALMFLDLDNLIGRKSIIIHDRPDPKEDVYIEDFNWAGLLSRQLVNASGEKLTYPVKPTLYTNTTRKQDVLDHVPAQFFECVFYKKSNADPRMIADLVSLGRDILELAGKGLDFDLTIKVFSGDYDFLYPVQSLVHKAQKLGIQIFVDLFAWKGTIATEWNEWKNEFPGLRIIVLNYCGDHFTPSAWKKIQNWNVKINGKKEEPSSVITHHHPRQGGMMAAARAAQKSKE